MRSAVDTVKENNKEKKNGDQETSKAGKKKQNKTRKKTTKTLERVLRPKKSIKGAEIFPEIFSSRRNHLFFSPKCCSNPLKLGRKFSTDNSLKRR